MTSKILIKSADLIRLTFDKHARLPQVHLHTVNGIFFKLIYYKSPPLVFPYLIHSFCHFQEWKDFTLEHVQVHTVSGDVLESLKSELIAH